MRRISIFGSLCLALTFGAACGDDDGGNAVCGNDAIEGSELCDQNQVGTETCATQGFASGTLTCDNTCQAYDTTQCIGLNCGDGAIDTGEQCDDTNLDGNDCTDVPGGFTGGTLACAANCTFDTSSCTGATTCGDSTVDTGEDCDTANLDGNDCTDVGNYVGGTLACAGDCTFDTTNCTPPVNCGNGSIDTGEDCDDTNLNSNDCTTVTGGFDGGTLACAGDCTFNTTGCMTTNEQIVAARATADGTANANINGAWVTYLRDGYGSDPMGGFHIQAEQLGPALFVQVDATTLATLTVGDEVSLDVLEMDTLYDLRLATSIANLTILSSGNNVSTLYQDLSAATDFVSALDSYESEVITLDATVVDAFASSGTEYQQATIETAGIQGDTALRMRIPTSVLATTALSEGCQFTATGVPVWRFNSNVQVGVWAAADITVNSCPALEVTGATAATGTDVDITFSAAIDAATLTDVPNQITFDLGVSAVTAVVNGSVVTVTTDGLSSGQLHTVTVANTVMDLLGAGVSATANSATFIAPMTNEIDCADGLDEDADGYPDCLDTDCTSDAACTWGAQLYIWEVDSDQNSTDTEEFVEIWNNTGADVNLGTDQIFLLFINGSTQRIGDAFELTGTVAAGDVYVVGQTAVPNLDQDIGGFLQNGAEGLMLVSCTGCGLSDFPSGHNPTPTAGTFSTANGRTATVLDAMAYDTNDSDIAALWAVLGVSTQWNEGTSHPTSLVRTSLTGYAQATTDPGNTGLQP